MTKGTDLGDWVQNLIKADMTKLQEGISVLVSKELLQAGDQLKALLRSIPIILEIKDDGERKDELAIFKQEALTIKDHTQGTYCTGDTVEEKIRAVQIVITTLIATHAAGRNAETLRDNMAAEIEKLLELPRVLSDARHQLCSNPSERALDFKGSRDERIKAVLVVVLHAEAFCVTNKLPPIVPTTASKGDFQEQQSLTAQNYPVKALL